MCAENATNIQSCSSLSKHLSRKSVLRNGSHFHLLAPTSLKNLGSWASSFSERLQFQAHEKYGRETRLPGVWNMNKFLYAFAYRRESFHSIGNKKQGKELIEYGAIFYKCPWNGFKARLWKSSVSGLLHNVKTIQVQSNKLAENWKRDKYLDSVE